MTANAMEKHELELGSGGSIGIRFADERCRPH